MGTVMIMICEMWYVPQPRQKRQGVNVLSSDLGRGYAARARRHQDELTIDMRGGSDEELDKAESSCSS